MEKKLAIRGHSTRGKEVINLLEMLGGKNTRKLDGSANMYSYYIFNNTILSDRLSILEDDDFEIFTLQGFLEKFPFKIHDLVNIPEYESTVGICGMRWDPYSKYVEYMVYRNDDEEWYTAEELLEYNGNFLEDKHCNEKQVNGMKSVLAELLDHIKNTSKEELEKEFNELEEWSNVGPTVEEFMDFCNKVNKKPKYPKLTNLTECKEILGEKDMYQGVSGYKGELLTNFQRLIIFRDVYWKIAGEEMGLDEPWKPDWLSGRKEEKYCIATQNNEIWHNFSEYGGNEILAFPTIEMRDTFYENFKDLIESCKELL